MKALLFVALWCFAPMAHTAADLFIDHVQTRRDDAPANAWQPMSLWQVDPQQRLIWVKGSIDLSRFTPDQRARLVIDVAAPVAYEAWWNGKFLGRNGTPASRRDAEVPGKLDSVLIVPASLQRAGNNELLLRMSSFHLPFRLQTPMQVILVRPLGEGPSEWDRRHAFRMAAAGALLLGAVYFGAQFITQRARERSSLLLSLLSLTVLGQLFTESLRNFVQYSYPMHGLRLLGILFFATAFSLLLVSYVSHYYARAHRRALLASTLVLVFVCTLFSPGFDGKTLLTLFVGLLVSGVAAAIGLRQRMRGAGLALLACIGALLIGIADIYRFVDQGYYLGVVALLLFLFGQQVVALRHSQQASAEAQLRSARLELELLKQQIRPHFLLNTLTALSEWIESQPATGVRMIEALGDELRSISVMSEAKTVPLRDELDLCRHYLRVMGYQRDRQFTLATEGIDTETPVPPTVFHTLLENVFTHSSPEDGAHFTLAEMPGTDGRRRFELRTPMRKSAPRAGSGAGNGPANAPGNGPANRRGNGKGHAYVRARLRDAFADNWAFSSGPTTDQPGADKQWLDVIELPRA
jgi:hypothetical protein